MNRNISIDATFKVYIVAEVVPVDNATDEGYLLTQPDTAFIRKNDGLAALNAARANDPTRDFVLYSFIVNPILHTVTIEVTGMDEAHAKARAHRQLGRVLS